MIREEWKGLNSRVSSRGISRSAFGTTTPRSRTLRRIVEQQHHHHQQMHQCCFHASSESSNSNSRGDIIILIWKRRTKT